MYFISIWVFIKILCLNKTNPVKISHRVFNLQKIDIKIVKDFSCLGTPLTYYGEEIGMVDNSGVMECMSDKRDPCRSPMQWNNDKNGGKLSIFWN